MGRSVSKPSGSIIAEYLHIEIEESWEFREFLDDVREVVQERYPSFRHEDKWLDNEDHAILRNDHALVGVSEYCGLVCVWAVVRRDIDTPELAQHWLESIVGNFHKHLAKRYGSALLRRIATASNGESFYERAA